MPTLSHPDLTKEQYLAIEGFVRETLGQVEKRQRTRYKLDIPSLTGNLSCTALAGSASKFQIEPPSSASNSRRGSMNDAGLLINGQNNGHRPQIVFTTGDGSATSSRSVSPTNSSRRSSYSTTFGNSVDRRGSALHLHVEDPSPGSRSRTSKFLLYNHITIKVLSVIRWGSCDLQN